MIPATPPDICHPFVSGTVQVREALDQMRKDVRLAGVDAAMCDTAQIILGEVLNNVVEHAYRFAEGEPIKLSIWVQDDGLCCEVRDIGVPMPNGVPPAGILSPVDANDRYSLPEGGFGWAMVRELTKDLQYFRKDGTNQLVFRIPMPDETAAPLTSASMAR